MCASNQIRFLKCRKSTICVAGPRYGSCEALPREDALKEAGNASNKGKKPIKGNVTHKRSKNSTEPQVPSKRYKTVHETGASEGLLESDGEISDSS